MGREVKRIALDFNYPINQMIWKGYSNPYRPLECKSCEGSGSSPEYRELSDDWYGFERPERKWCYNITQDEVEALVKRGRLWDLIEERCSYDEDTKKWTKWVDGKEVETERPKMPTPEQVNEWAQDGMGHDGINHWICTRVRAKRLGITETACLYCKGEGYLWPEDKYAELSENWEQIEPPEGKGYQLWSTTTEGTPMSPVFETPEDLARWLADTGASSFGSNTASYEEWLKFARGPGWAPSMIVSDGNLQDGVKCNKSRETL